MEADFSEVIPRDVRDLDVKLRREERDKEVKLESHLIISANLFRPFCRSEETLDSECQINIPVPELPAVISIIWVDMLALFSCCLVAVTTSAEGTIRPR